MEIPQENNPLNLNLIIPPNHDVVLDDKAQIEKDKLYGESKREQELKWTIHGAIKYFIWFIFGIGILLSFVRAVHFIIPEGWFWLNADQLLNLDTIAKYLISSAVGGLFIKYISKGVENN